MGSKKQKHLPHIPHSQRRSPSSVTRVGSPCLSQQDMEQTKQKGCCLFSPKQRKSDQSRNAVRLQLTNPIRPAHPIPATRQTPLLQPLHTQNTSSAGIWSKPETPATSTAHRQTSFVTMHLQACQFPPSAEVSPPSPTTRAPQAGADYRTNCRAAQMKCIISFCCTTPPVPQEPEPAIPCSRSSPNTAQVCVPKP